MVEKAATVFIRFSICRRVRNVSPLLPRWGDCPFLGHPSEANTIINLFVSFGSSSPAAVSGGDAGSGETASWPLARNRDFGKTERRFIECHSRVTFATRKLFFSLAVRYGLFLAIFQFHSRSHTDRCKSDERKELSKQEN